MFDLQNFLKANKITQKQFSKEIGKSQTAISMVVNGEMDLPKEWLELILETYKVNPDDYILENSAISHKGNEPAHNYRKQPSKLALVKSDTYGKEIPFYETEVFATISPAMGDVVALRPDTFIRIPMFSQGEFALTVTGHSMKGYIDHGSWIVVKRITDREEIIYGEPHLIVTKADNLKTVKFLKKGTSADTFWLVPYNVEQFEPQEIKKTSVLELYRVIGVFKSV